MIERYTRPEMAAIWSDDSRFSRWLEIEILACEARAALGMIPCDAARRIRANARFDISEILRVEERTRHDMIAFVSVVGDSLGEDASYFHEGLTSSDILDTCLAMQMRDACMIIAKDLDLLIRCTADLAVKYKNTICIGRTHGIHAEPTTFGLKCAVWYQDLLRAQNRLTFALEDIAVGKLSGAVGNFAHLPPAAENYVMAGLHLKPEPVATQVVQRDRHAMLMCVLGLIAAVAEKIAIEIRHCQRTEVLELEEPFERGQRGSSAMPHKKNPILCENISGLARLVKGYVVQSMDNIALWHERDISHSSVERVIFPDAMIALDFLLDRLHSVLNGLIVNTDRMTSNLNMLHGLIFSQKILLAITGKGIARDRAYELVQRNALQTWAEGTPFRDNLLNDRDIRDVLTKSELDDLFDVTAYLVHIDQIYDRIGLLHSSVTPC
ncbi:adenylosuccinate lyase [bacterium]|nr:adenylosuccinate lyase [candidate division CSSED10-310 bacterium]